MGLKKIIRKFGNLKESTVTFVNTYKVKCIFDIKYNIVKNQKKSFIVCRGGIIERKVRFLLRKSGNFKLGENSRLCRNNKIVINGGDLLIGCDVTVGENCIFNVFSNVIIKDNVLMADKINFITNEHGYMDINLPINAQEEFSKEIYIGEESWIGINVTILAGTYIGKHCVIGANSVVKGKYPDYCVIAGNPAKVIKKYDLDKKQWERVSHNAY